MKTLDAIRREQIALFRDPDAERLSKWHYRGYDQYIWVPVDKPKFIGWETILTLSEPGARRRDAYRMQQVMEILRLTEPRFTKDTYIVKLIRKAGHKYLLTRAMYLEDKRRDSKYPWKYWNDLPSGVMDINNMFIKPKDYEELPKDLKCFFEEYKKYHPATWCSEEWTEVKYRLGGKFPLHELRLKIVKAYSTHRGIPKADEISRDQEIDDILEDARFYNKRYGRSRSKWYDKRVNRNTRKRWNTVMKKVNKGAEFDEVEVHAYRGRITDWW